MFIVSASLLDALWVGGLCPTRLRCAVLRCGGWGYDDSASLPDAPLRAGARESAPERGSWQR